MSFEQFIHDCHVADCGDRKDESILTTADLIAARNRVVYTTESGTRVKGRNFLRLVGHRPDVALRLFHLCSWQHPETLIDEDENAAPEDRCFPELFAADPA